MKARQERWVEVLIVAVAAGIAFAGARPYAASFNDGSRLATVESLVDQHTFAIDQSIFVQPPPPGSGRPLPYTLSAPTMPEFGTLDKVRIRGHYYSEKPPVPAVLMAGLYELLQALFGLNARARPDLFCYAMTVGSCGLAYVVAVWALYRLGRALGLARGLALGLTASFALGSVALPYTRHVNGHIQLLGVAVPAFLILTRLGENPSPAARRWLGLVLGTLLGLGYTIEQPTGGLLALGVLLLLAWRQRGLREAVVVGLAAFPWFLFHHGLVYSFAGTFRPVNTFPEFFDYPGSAFAAGDLTGFYHHRSIASLIFYAGSLVFGERGFLQHNLPLLLAVPAAVVLLRRRPREAPVVVLACAWAVGTWVVWSLLSTNYSGSCCSVRWFVPLLAAGYYLLALLLRDMPAWRTDVWILSGWGIVLGGVMWWEGTWGSAIPFFWEIQAAALATWLAATRLLPRFLERALDWLPRLGWPLLILVTIGPLVVALPDLGPAEDQPGNLERSLRATIPLLLGFVVGVRARADRRDSPNGAWLTLGFALLAGLLTAVHAQLVDRDPRVWAWQRDLQARIFEHVPAATNPQPLGPDAGAPHLFRPLPYGFAHLLEWLSRNGWYASLAYRWFFTFWFIWAWYRFARLFLAPAPAVATLLVLPLLYPLSVQYYWGQLADPLSHSLLVLGLIYVVEQRPVALGMALGLGVLAKETAVLLVPAYLACHRRQGVRAWLTTAALGAVAVAAFLAARLPLGWRPGHNAINGVSGWMIGTNLGFGPHLALTSVPLYENYLQPLLFVGMFVPWLVWRWHGIDPRLRVLCATFVPLLLASNLCFGWMYESRNYVPLLPLLTTAILSGRHQPRKERHKVGA